MTTIKQLIDSRQVSESIHFYTATATELAWEAVTSSQACVTRFGDDTIIINGNIADVCAALMACIEASGAAPINVGKVGLYLKRKYDFEYPSREEVLGMKQGLYRRPGHDPEDDGVFKGLGLIPQSHDKELGLFTVDEMVALASLPGGLEPARHLEAKDLTMKKEYFFTSPPISAESQERLKKILERARRIDLGLK